MAIWQMTGKIGPKGEQHSLSVFVVRSLMAFLGAAGVLGCIFSSLAIAVEPGVSDIIVVLGSVLFTEAMLWTGYHPYCAACEAGICVVFGLIKRKETALAVSIYMEKYAEIRSGGTSSSAVDLNGETMSPEVEKMAGAGWGHAVFGALLVCILVWLLGQKIRRLLPALFLTGILPAFFVAAGASPGYVYLEMLCLFWAMLFFDADELKGPSLFIVPLICAAFLGVLAAVPHVPHDPIDLSRPMGMAATPATVGGENHDPVTETESTGETLPNEDDPEDADPGGESEPRPDRRGEDGMEVPRQIARILIAVLTIACLLLLIPVTRLIRLRLRRRRTHSRDRNASAIAEYGYMEQLSKFAGDEQDADGEIWCRATEIGLKARFSGTAISGDELREMHHLSSYYRHICMGRANRLKSLYGKYYLAL